MYLKRLEVHGFKTFAQRTVFEFPPGITAIVGPNGSGKSNVADVLRWVLGEQSFGNLRAKRTDDLLYSGGRGRAPHGFAEATVTIDNCDRLLPLAYDEVSIGRRAYRSGENEYSINRTRVRLRDVLDCVAPLGSSYTIINQGLVDLALALQPEERRRLFEDAAEIGPYRAKRAEAERRLRETESNLVRLSDLLSELEPQLRSLARQGRDAEAVGAVQAELAALLDVFYRRQWHATSQRLARAESAAAQVAAALDSERREREAIERELNAAREASRDARSQLERLQQEAAALEREQQDASRELAVGAERGAGIDSRAAEQQRRRAELDAELASLQQRLDATETRRRQTQAELAAARAGLADAQRTAQREQSERDAAERAFAAQRETSIRAQAAIEREQTRLDELVRRAETAAAELLALDESVARQREVGKVRAAHLAAATRSLRDAETAIETAQATVDVHRQRIEQLRRERDAADEGLAAARRLHGDLHARLDAIGRLARAREGAHAGVRAALQWAEREGRRFELVSSLLRVPAELETAIEIALGSRLQHIAVATWADAEAAIGQLKRSGAGRATFLPLDTLRPARRAVPPALPGIRGVAADLVDVDEQARPIAAYLLGRTLVADDLDAARRALPRLEGGWTIVTLEGELIAGGGAVTGGSATREGGVLRRERELRELPQQVERARAAVVDEQGRREAAAGALDAAQAEQRGSEARLSEARRARDSAQRAAEAARREHHRTEDDLETRLRRRDALEREAAGFAQQRAAVRGDLDAAVAAHAAATAAAAAAGAVVAAQIAAIGDDQAALAEQRELVVAADAELRRHTAELDVLRAAIARAEAERQQLERLATELDREARALSGQLEAAAARELGLRTEIETAGERLAAAAEARGRLEHTLETLEGRERSHLARMLELDAAHVEAAIELERRRTEQDTLLERAGEDNVDLAAPGAVPGPAADDRDLDRSIEQLRNRLRRMGPVNMLAPQEHRAARERYDFLSAQLADVRTAAAALREAIGQLDHVMQQQFSATFEAVAHAFSASFTRLFGGGSARLVLRRHDQHNGGPDEGIDLIVQPPGKRELNLQLLSGGERALTAAALLFAILKVNPSPFCILDEVDAALDEANVVRFREALLELAGGTQFIVITHNRGTVEVADTLYGITMGDDGASRVLSLRLEEVDDTLQIVA